MFNASPTIPSRDAVAARRQVPKKKLNFLYLVFYFYFQIFTLLIFNLKANCGKRACGYIFSRNFFPRGLFEGGVFSGIRFKLYTNYTFILYVHLGALYTQWAIVRESVD